MDFFRNFQFTAFEDVKSTEERDKEIDRLEHQMEIEAAQKRYERSGVPQRYFNESFLTFVADTDERKKVFDASKHFVQNVRIGKSTILVLLGSSGTGKTHLACSCLRELGGKYRESAPITEAVQQARYSYNSAPTNVIRDLVKCTCLVIDEIGRTKSDDEIEVLFRLMNALYNENRSAIFIGNFHNQKAFFSYVGSAFVDRLTENGVVVEVKGESFRKNKRGR